MKFKDPFDLKGSLEVEANYKVGKKLGKFSSNGAAKVPMPWEPGEIQINVDVDYELAKFGGVDWKDLQMAYMGEGKFGVSAQWRAVPGDDGMELIQVGAAPSGTPKSDGDINVAVGAGLLTQSVAREKTSFVKFDITLLAGLESQGIGVGYGPVSTTMGGGSRIGDTKQIGFTINLEVEKPAAKNDPKPIPKIPNRLLKPDPILYDEDEDYLPREAVSKLRTWSNEVKDIPELKHLIVGGFVDIKLEAFASTTGTPKQNKQETDKRLDQVMKTLKDEFKVPTLTFDTKSWGDKKADGKGPKNPRNRRVEIEIDGIKVNQLLKAFFGN